MVKICDPLKLHHNLGMCGYVCTFSGMSLHNFHQFSKAPKAAYLYVGGPEGRVGIGAQLAPINRSFEVFYCFKP